MTILLNFVLNNEASQATFNLNKRILIQQPFLNWVYASCYGRLYFAEENTHRHPPLPPRNGLQPVAVEYAPSTTNFSLERKPLVSLQNEVQEMSAENPYWWPIITQCQERNLVEVSFPCGKTNQEHCPDLGSNASSVWNFCTHFSVITLWENQQVALDMMADFSGYANSRAFSFSFFTFPQAYLIWWYNQQCCQLSQIIRETPEFGLYFLVSRLESDISQIIAKVAISHRLDFLTIKFQIFCFVWASVNMAGFLINSGMSLSFLKQQCR